MWRQAPNLTSNPRFLPGWFGWLLWWCKLNQLWIYILPKQAASIIFSLTFSFSSKFLPTVSPGWRWAISKRTVHNCSSRKGMFSSQTFSSRRFYREKKEEEILINLWGGEAWKPVEDKHVTVHIMISGPWCYVFLLIVFSQSSSSFLFKYKLINSKWAIMNIHINQLAKMIQND